MARARSMPGAAVAFSLMVGCAASPGSPRAPTVKQPPSGAPPAGWVHVVSEDGQFEGDFPGRPTLEKNAIDSKVGLAQQTLYRFVTEDGVQYLLSRIAYPSKDITLNVVRRAADGSEHTVCESTARSSNATKVLYDRAISHQGWPGMDCRLEGMGPDGTPVHIWSHAVQVERELYLADVYGPAGRVDEARVSPFVNGFRLAGARQQ